MEERAGEKLEVWMEDGREGRGGGKGKGEEGVEEKDRNKLGCCLQDGGDGYPPSLHAWLWKFALSSRTTGKSSRPTCVDDLCEVSGYRIGRGKASVLTLWASEDSMQGGGR